ncbi:MAG: glycosyltransferase family 2 protein [Dehalococcoidia bacterium]|nr:glycosyltransferase family 2 protein [Dehalococcoidia bacterium]
MTVPEAVAALLSAVVLAHAAWWLVLSLLALLPLRQRKGEPPAGDTVAMTVIVPAHDEETMLPATLRSLQAAATPATSVLVVADNCSDATADIAHAVGVTVVERHDPDRRGKSYALDVGLATLRQAGTKPDVVVFVDADCEVSPGFFHAIAAAFRNPRVRAAQAYYAPAEPISPLGRLRRLAFALLHYARPLGARRVGLPTTLKGTGMALRWELVVDGFGAGGLAEDAAFTLSLARRGVVAEFLPSVVVTGHMAQEYDLARTQDHRWERGRLGLAREAMATAMQAILHGRPRPAAAALEVASLPMSMLVFLSAGVLGVALVGVGRVDVALLAVVLLVAYVAVGAVAARVPLSDTLALVTLPRFLVHKLGIYARALFGGQLDWTRTRR